MKTILVSGASGIVGYGILRSLRRTGRALRLIGTSIYDDSVAPAFCDVFELAPRTTEPGYIDWLMNTIAKHEIDLIVPGIEADVYKWAEHADELRHTGAVVLLNNIDLIELCKDKWTFYERLRDARMPCAIETSLTGEFEELRTRFGLPFLLKPRRGFASKGIVRVDGEATFDAHRAEIGPTLMAQPIVGNDDAEFTTAAFCDGRGRFSALMTLRRKLSKDGFTEKAEVVASGEFVALTKELCARFRPVGPTNFQFRMARDGIKLLEINPRISSSTSIRAAFGYNESEMAVDYFLGRRMPAQPQIRGGRAVRFTDEYIFHDDSVHL